jgi:hypothetical protein
MTLAHRLLRRFARPQTNHRVKTTLAIESLEGREVPAALGYTGGLYQQNFDGLPNTGTFSFTGNGPFDLSDAPVNATNLVGWQIANNGSGANAIFNVNDGQNTVGAHSYGVTASTDRALGSFANDATSMRYGLTLRNDSTTTFGDVAISFINETWRRGATINVDTHPFEYAVGATATTINDGTFITNAAGNVSTVPGIPASSGPLNGNTNSNSRMVTLSGTTWAPGEFLTIRWTDSNTPDGNDDGNGIDNFSLFANPVGTTTTITSIVPTTLAFGDTITFNASVTADSGSTTPTGSVRFVSNGSTQLAQGPVTGSGATGTVSVTTSTLNVGTYTNVTAEYLPNTIGFLTSTSGTFGSDVVVTGVNTTTSLTSISPLTTSYGTPVVLKASVMADSGSNTPTGTVSFFSGATLLGTGTLTGSGVLGTVEVSASTILPGSYPSITAVYAPTGAFGSSSSMPSGDTLTVNVPYASYTSGAQSVNFDALPQAGSTFFSTNGPHFLRVGVANSATLNGWQVVNTGTGVGFSFSADNGSTDVTNAYSYGPTGNSDRALGSFANSTTTPRFGVTYRNDSSTTYSKVAITFTQEVWRRGSTPIDTLPFEYAVGADAVDIQTGTYTFDPAGDLTTISGPAAGAVDGNTVNAVRNVSLTGLTWAPGEYLTLRWTDSNSASGADDGLAIDNFSMAADPVATTAAITSISPTSATFGSPVTFNATVTAVSGTTTPSGTVTFKSGSTVLATAAVTGSGATGTASVTSSTVAIGSYPNIVAEYTPTIAFQSSTSNPFGTTVVITGTLAPTITSAKTATILSGSPATFQVTATGVPATFTYSLTGAPTWATIDTAGLITFDSNRPTITGNTPYAFTVNVSNGINPDAQQTFTVTDTLPIIDFTKWNFSSVVAAPVNSPAPTTGTGLASIIGHGTAGSPLTFTGHVGDVANGDILFTNSNAVPTGHHLWRIRGTPNNGWATHAAGAPQFSQGVQLSTSTVGYADIRFSFDWYGTNQGPRDLQFQYNLNINNAGGWTNFGGTSPTGTYVNITPEEYYLAANASPRLTVDLTSITGANNNPNFGVRLVSAFDSTGNLGNEYASSVLVNNLTQSLNNTSGNWRIGNMTFSGTVAPAQPTVTTVTVQNGDTQRSRLTTITVAFDGPVTATAFSAANAITLTRTAGGASTVVASGATGANGRVLVAQAGSNALTLTFDNANATNVTDGVEYGSLADGRWRLAIPGANNYQSPLNGDNIRRLFGNLNADGTVDGADLTQFGNAFGTNFLAADWNADNTVDGADLTEFGNRFGITF